jgi:hypothetical protein
MLDISSNHRNARAAPAEARLGQRNRGTAHLPLKAFLLLPVTALHCLSG